MQYRFKVDIPDPTGLPIILDLCSGTESWSKPYRETGRYDVRCYDILQGDDVRLLQLTQRVHGVLASPPCTVFARGGNHIQRSDSELLHGLSVVDACLRIIYATRPKWWALENPSGRLQRYLGSPRLKFDPCDYGDPYTKLTYLWGDFTIPLRTPVEPHDGSKMHHAVRNPTYRSATPPGFARAFMEANR